MKTYTTTRGAGTQLLALGLASLLCTKPIVAHADDIDIFVGASAGKAGNPRVLIVLDNTSNWARQNQKWPDGASQGQSEAAAIRQVIGDLDDSVNVGLMEFVTAGNANDNGGFIRHAVAPLDTDNKTALSTKLTTIYNGINSPDEKRNSNTPYGNLMLDVYSYLAGGSSYSPGGVLSTIADRNGYASAFSRFKSPITADATCGKTFMIFISNPNASGPASDSNANSAALAAANGGPVTQLRLQGFEETPVATTTRVGTTSACYANAAAAAAELPAFSSSCAAFGDGCAIGAPTTPSAPLACPTGTRTYTVVQSVYTPASGSGGSAGTPVRGTTTTSTAPSTGYYAAAGEVPASDTGGLSCPATSTVTSNGSTTTTTYSCTYSVGAAIGSATVGTSSATTSACYTGVGTAGGNWNPATSSDRAGLSCPANATCTYSGTLNNGAAGCGGNSGTRKVNVTQTATSKRKYTISMAVTPTTTSSSGGTVTPATTTTKVLGKTSQCYASAPASTGDYGSECSGTNISCTYNNNPTGSTFASCPAGTSVYTVEGRDVAVETRETSAYSTDSGPRNADEWARLMYEKGIPIEGSTIRPSVTTYTVDVYNAQQNAEHTSLMMSMARAGGGKYFAAKNQAAIVDALRRIMIEIQAVNTAFASTSLPVNATNRSQNENQVFIGMFRPDPRARPRWFGNLKRYQLISASGNVELGDVDGKLAVNPITGFITPCASSWWTSDSKDYWAMTGLDPVPKGTCTASSYNPFSDAPDGPLVEKGAAAQILRQGNVGGADTGMRTLKRSVLTEHGGAMADFSTATSGLSASLVDFIRGADVNNERGLGKLDEVRPSVHGDVIHSRPLPVNYGNKGVTVYYGANDGTLHAVDADSGVERWAFVAPEFYPRLARLKDNSPLVNYPNIKAELVTPAPTRKDYFFDGSIGLYQNADNSKVMIFPTMRRGGRMIYALDVTTPGSPKFAWKAGCPNLSNDEGCTTGMAGIGQTWSIPNVAFIKGYSSTEPVVVVGGGYDNCEDADSASPSCGATKGGKIYVLNAFTGALVKSFDTGRGVAADVAMVDITGDGSPDYAYAADIGGTIYRIDFIDGPESRRALAASSWTSRAVAHTSGGGRKFLFAPALLGNQTRVYVAIGSGDREHPLEAQYAYKEVTNRFYVYKDDLTLGLGAPSVNLDNLADHTLKNSCDAPMVLPESDLQGWYINLNQYGQGEQTVTSALIATGMVTFSTNRPLPEKAGTCSTTLGEAGGYWLNLFNGAGAIGVEGACGGQRRSVFIGGGLPPSPVMATVKVGDRVMSVVMGAAQRGSTGAKSANVAFSPQKVRPPIRSARKRSYSYTVSD